MQALQKVNELKEVNSGYKKNIEIKLTMFPYTYSKIWEYIKSGEKKEEQQEYAITVNTPPVETYEEEINF